MPGASDHKQAVERAFGAGSDALKAYFDEGEPAIWWLPWRPSDRGRGGRHITRRPRFLSPFTNLCALLSRIRDLVQACLEPAQSRIVERTAGIAVFAVRRNARCGQGLARAAAELAERLVARAAVHGPLVCAC